MSERFVVEVNEGTVEASQQGIEWWDMFTRRFSDTGRLVYTKQPCIVGGVVEVACASKDDATWLAAQMVDVHGLPRTAVRVKVAAQASDECTVKPSRRAGRNSQQPKKRRVETLELPDLFGGAA